MSFSQLSSLTRLAHKYQIDTVERCAIGTLQNEFMTDLEKWEREGRDWRLMPDVHTVINTLSSIGVHVNGEKLTARNEEGEVMCGRLYTGDVIEIFTSRNRESGSQQTLKFVCEFYVGEAERRRPEELAFKPVVGTEPGAPRQSF